MSLWFSFFTVKSPTKSFFSWTSKLLSRQCCREQACLNSVKNIQFELWSEKYSCTAKRKVKSNEQKRSLVLVQWLTVSAPQNRDFTSACLAVTLSFHHPSLGNMSTPAAPWQISSSLSFILSICSYDPSNNISDVISWFEWY